MKSIVLIPNRRLGYLNLVKLLILEESFPNIQPFEVVNLALVLIIILETKVTTFI